jgi:hypothetical protein
MAGHILAQYSIVCQALGEHPYTVCAYSGTDLSKILGITQARAMPPGTYGWIQECGAALIRVGGQTRPAYADFRPNAARLGIDAPDDKSFDPRKIGRLCHLLPLLIESGPYCQFLRDARDLFVDGHFYACVMACGVSLEKFQRDKAKAYGPTRNLKMPEIQERLGTRNAVRPQTLDLCRSMAKLRNEYAHGEGSHPETDAAKAIGWVYSFVDVETNLMRGYVIADGMLVRKG